MFSHVSVILFTGGWVCLVPGPLWESGYAWSRSIPRGGWVYLVHPSECTPTGRYIPPRRYTTLVLTYSGGHRSGRYASYWNTFLLVYVITVSF